MRKPIPAEFGMSDETRYDGLESYLSALKRQRPDVKPYEEDDWDWMDEGLDYLEDGQMGLAEMKFQELVLSQPNHFDGYEGLARVYLAVGRKREAEFLAAEALRLARKFVQEGDADPECVATIEGVARRVAEMPDEPEGAVSP
jgi:tetratricopeptide (TPR) repeat protein